MVFLYLKKIMEVLHVFFAKNDLGNKSRFGPAWVNQVDKLGIVMEIENMLSVSKIPCLGSIDDAV